MKKDQVKALLVRAASQYIDKLLEATPFSEEHLRLLEQALSKGNLRLENGTIVFPDGRKWSLVTINREYVTQLGMYLKLQQQYPSAEIKLEDQFMDLVVYGNKFKIAIEVKKSLQDSERLAIGLFDISKKPNMNIIDRGNDALRKAKAILNLRPDEFWIACPEQIKKFKVCYQTDGFELVELKEDIKAA